MARIKIKDLTPNQTYYIQVRAKSETDYSPWSPRYSFDTQFDATAPTTPTAPSIVVDGTSFVFSFTGVNLSLAQNVDFSHYEIEFVGNSVTKLIQTSNTSYTVTFEENRAFFNGPSATVQARVRSYDLTGNASSWSAQVSATNQAPAAPTGFTGMPVADGVYLTWNVVNEPDIKYYRVYVGSTASPVPAGLIFEGDATSFNYGTSTYSRMYYAVRAVDVFGSQSPAAVAGPYTPISPFVVDTTPPSTPTGLTATITTEVSADLKTKAAVTFNIVSDMDLASYILRYKRSAEPSTAWQQVRIGKHNPGDTTVSTTVYGLIPYANYDFQVAAVDLSANTSAYSATFVATAAANIAPAIKPATPTASSSTMRVQVSISGLDASGNPMPADVASYEVYASKTSNFTPTTADRIGTIDVSPAMIGTFTLPANTASVTPGVNTDTWYIKVRAVDSGGLFSPYSDQATATPGLIENANIANATITTAKVNELSVGKLSAGSINTGDITVQTKLILGDATHVGVLETYDYTSTGGTSGTRLDKNGIIVKSGTIEANALRIQQGENIFTNPLTSFELPSTYYHTTGAGATGAIAYNFNTVSGINDAATGITTARAWSGSQSLRIANAAATTRVLFLRTGTTNNIRFPEPGEYIVSFYVYPTVTNPITFNLYNGAVASHTAYTTPTLVANQWNRVYTTWNILAGATSLSLGISFPGVVATWDIDAIQVERKISGSDLPSIYVPTSLTTINGAVITTGSIRSANYSANDSSQPMWSINTDGSATFSALRVLGNTVLGKDTTDTASYIQSANYTPEGEGQGWKILATGIAEFKDLVSESVSGPALKIGTLDANRLMDSTIVSNLDVTGSIKSVGSGGSQVRLDASGLSYVSTTASGNNTLFQLPNDGTGVKINDAVINAKSITVTGDPATATALTINSNSYVAANSFLYLRDAATRPEAPVVSSGWKSYPTSITGITPVGSPYWTTGTTLRFLAMTATAGTFAVYDVNYTTGATTLVATLGARANATGAGNTGSTVVGGTDVPTDTNNRYGFAIIGTNYYVMSKYVANDSAGSPVVTVFRIDTYNSAGTFVSSIKTSASGESAKTPSSMGSNGTTMFMVYPGATNTDNHRVRSIGTDGTLGSPVSLGRKFLSIRANFVSNADLGAPFHFVTGFASVTPMSTFVFSSAGSESMAERFEVPSSSVNGGPSWDSTNLRFAGVASIDGVAKSYMHGKNRPSGTYSVSYAYYNQALNYHSLPSPQSSINLLNRAFLVVSTDSGTQPNARVYVGSGSPTVANNLMYAQGLVPGSGMQTTYYESFVTGTANPVTTSTIPGQASYIRTEVTDTDDGTAKNSIELKSDGTGRIRTLRSNALTVNTSITRAGTGGTWVDITTFQNGYTAVANQQPQYRIDASGNVHIRGAVARAAATSGQAVFTLPSGFLPVTTATNNQHTAGWFSIIRTNTVGSYATLQVQTGGNVVISFTGTPTAFGLEAVFSTQS